MTLTANEEPAIPVLFAHKRCVDWGVGILASENDGKRHYLFQDGQERILANAFDALMTRIERPTPEQYAAFAQLRKLLLTRSPKGGAVPTTAAAAKFEAQMTRFHETYPAGFSDPMWTGEAAESAPLRKRQVLIDQAREEFSSEALDTLLSSQRFDGVWELVMSVLRRGELVSPGQLRHKPTGETVHEFAAAVREVLYGAGPYVGRFDRYVAALTAALGKPPSWELATALSAVVHPSEHVCVELVMFRRQAKAIATRRAIATRPSGAAYTAGLALARSLVNKLGEHAEVPRNLLDVRDFIMFTLTTATKPKVKKA